MKALIVYGSKYGATRQAAGLLAEAMGEGAALHDLANGQPDLAPYGTVVVGGPIYAGMLRKEVKAFCQANQQALQGKNLGLFICCSTPKEADGFFAQNFPAELLEHAAAKANLGGLIEEGRLKGMDRFIMKMVAKSREKAGDSTRPELDNEAIQRFAAAVMQAAE